MVPYLMVVELTTGQKEPFAVIAVDPSQRESNGCKGWVQSLHMTREEADAALSTVSSTLRDEVT